ncbi:sensor histidine kinase [Haloferax namakaokahaiae]|uniref:histidine kinase n=1 Tax=Haloferax namakaokahaiae TaxID=1748331 RepID=A0ABD5ZET0_9EURY
MGLLRGESTPQFDVRPVAVATGIILGLASLQFIAFSTGDGSYYRFAVELLLIPVALGGTAVISVVRETPTVWRPLYIGTIFVAIYATTDALDELLVQPDSFSILFEDVALLVGVLSVTVGMVRWADLRQTYEDDLAARNERLDQFASVVSHDLRNPLNVAQIRLELARDGHGMEHLETVADAHERMEALIEDVLHLSRSGETVGETEPVGLARIAADAVANTKLDAASLTVEADATLRADRERLVTVFENLFRNALDHAGPDVQVRVGLLDDGFFVEDDGPGIPHAERERIFESGYTTDTNGTGLGLAIVSGVVEAHDWTATATEAESGGARFEFRDVAFENGATVSTSASRQ